MNIMENKRVTAITAAMVLVFGFLCYKTYQNYSSLQNNLKEINSKNEQMEAYRSEKLAPTDANRKALAEASKEVEQMAADLSRDMKRYAAYCIMQKTAGSADGQGDVPLPIVFQNRLRSLSAQLTHDAEGRTLLRNGSGDLGMTKLKNQAPTVLAAPYYNFLLTAINGALHHIVAAGAPSIERVYCAPLPEDEVTARKKSPYIRLGFEVAFTAKRSEVIDPKSPDTLSVIPQVINKLTQDPNVFYIITGMAVNTLHGAPVTTNPHAATAVEGETESTEDAPTRVASLILGSPDEHVNVHLSIQVLYFDEEKI